MSHRNKELDDVLNKARLEALDIAVHENHEYLATIKELRELLSILIPAAESQIGVPCTDFYQGETMIKVAIEKAIAALKEDS